MVSLRHIYSAAVILLLSAVMFQVFPEISSETASQNLYVTSDPLLASSTFVRSGDGTSTSPYIISDWDMGSYYMRLENTISHLIIRNITFTSDTSWAIYLDNCDNIDIYNVSSTQRGRFLYSVDCQDIIINNCNVTSIPTSTNTVEINNGVRLEIRNSRFTADDMASSRIYFNDQGNNQKFISNHLDGIDLTDLDFNNDGRILNSTFSDSTVTLTDARQGSAVSGNIMISQTDELLVLNTCYLMEISKNYFEGLYGIHFYTATYQNSGTWGNINNNTFESCEYGIISRLDWQSRPTWYKVTNNYFGNCSIYAIDWGYAMTCRVWKNVFYHNSGTDNSSSGSQCKQYNWGQQAYKIIWTENDQGNFWANHRTPDNDLDGIVDVPYSILNGGSDTHPFTNPYFDTARPVLDILSPTVLYPDRSYLVLDLRLEDEGSGIKTLEMRIDGGPWKDMPISGKIPIFLEEGNHYVNLKATDRAGMQTSVFKQYILSETFEFMEITYPLENEYRTTGVVDIQWEIEDYFEPVNQSITIKGEVLYLDPLLRVFRTQLEEGRYDVKVEVRDQGDFSRSDSVNFTIDLTDPEVSIISPQDGSKLSNSFVRIYYEAEDNFDLDKVEIRLDGGNWSIRPLDEFQYSQLLDQGLHHVDIRATDLSGRTSLDNISFEIGRTDLLRFTSPLNGSSFREGLVQIEWEYGGPFQWERSLLRVGKNSDLVDIGGQRTINVTLENDGFYDIDLRLVDQYENYIETSIVIVKDTVSPIVEFNSPIEGLYYSNDSLEVSWSGIDNIDLPMERYELKIDNGNFTDMGRDLSTEVTIGEGEHTLTLRAFDRAGNSAETSVSFLIDRTPPSASITYPIDGSIVTDTLITLKFSGSDDNGIQSMNLYIDEDRNITVTSRTSYETTIGSDGEHWLDLVVVDKAGNRVTRRIHFFMDTIPPRIEWIRSPEGVTAEGDLMIEWRITEASGLETLMLMIDGSRTDLDVDERNYSLSLDEGSHRISLKAVDKAGLVSELFTESSLLVDMTPPAIQIDQLRSKPTGNSAVLYWTSEDESSEIDSTFISLDGGEFEEVPASDRYAFEGLSLGDHNVILRVYDIAGNFRDVNWTFTVELGNGGTETSEDDIDPIPYIVAGFIIFLLFVFLVIVMVVRNRKKREREELEEKRRKMAKKPSKIDVGIPAAPSASSLPVDTSTVSDLPPPGPPPKVEETRVGSGYIRPKRDKKSKKKVKKVMESPGEQKEDPGDLFMVKEQPSKAPETVLEGVDKDLKETPDELEEDVKDEQAGVDTGPERVDDSDVNWDEDEGEVIEEFEELDEMEELEEMEDIEEFEDLDEIEDIEEWNEDEDIEEWG